MAPRRHLDGYSFEESNWNWTDLRLPKGRVLLPREEEEEVDDGGGIIDFLGGHGWDGSIFRNIGFG